MTNASGGRLRENLKGLLQPIQPLSIRLLLHYLEEHCTLDNSVPVDVGCAEAVSFILQKSGIAGLPNINSVSSILQIAFDAFLAFLAAHRSYTLVIGKLPSVPNA